MWFEGLERERLSRDRILVPFIKQNALELAVSFSSGEFFQDIGEFKTIKFSYLFL